MENKTVPVEVWKKREDGSFFTETVEVPQKDFQGAYFFFNQVGFPTLVLNDGRIVVLKGDVCSVDNLMYYDEDARNE